MTAPPLPPPIPRPSWVRSGYTAPQIEAGFSTRRIQFDTFPTPPRWQPPPATVVGIMSADEREIILTVSGEDASIEKAAEKIGELTAKVTLVSRDVASVPLNWPTYMQLACTFGSHFSPDTRLHTWFLGELTRRTNWVDKPMRYQLPAGLTLKPWQPLSVLNVAHTGCLLEDAPRLGKTISAIVGLAERNCWPEYRPVLPIGVVCPASVVTAWVEAFELFTPHWRVCKWRGANKETRQGWVGNYDVYVTSYGTARVDANYKAHVRDAPLVRCKCQTVIIDEHHWIGNPDAKQTRATQRLARQSRLVVPLSGTSFRHHMANMKPTLEVFERGAYPNVELIINRWIIEKTNNYEQVIKDINPQTEPELRACFLGRQLRRSREDVAPWMSQPIYSTRVVPIPEPYLKMYRDMEQKMIAEIDEGVEVTALSSITKMTRLQQLAASACDLTTDYTEDPETGLPVAHQHLHPKLPSWKIDAMIEILAELEWPALSFGISKPLMLLAGQEAERQGARVGYVVGGQSMRQRDQYVAAFQAGKLDLLCVVVQAGGTGLTLNAAGTEIFLQRPVSFVDSLQAEDRGVGEQHQTLDVIDIVAENSIDERIRYILHGKAGNLSTWLADPRIVRQLFGGKIKT